MSKTEPPKTRWVTSFPETKTKKELEGVPLTILEDCPPEVAAKAGMYNLKVLSMTDSRTYFVLVTARDVGAIAKFIREKKKFTFVPSEKNDLWSEVAELMECRRNKEP